MCCCFISSFTRELTKQLLLILDVPFASEDFFREDMSVPVKQAIRRLKNASKSMGDKTLGLSHLSGTEHRSTLVSPATVNKLADPRAKNAEQIMNAGVDVSKPTMKT